jgi:hypothetical protein
MLMGDTSHHPVAFAGDRTGKFLKIQTGGVHFVVAAVQLCDIRVAAWCRQRPS